MSTKAQIQALIDSKLPDGGNILASDHRDVLKDDTNSLSNNIFSNVVVDTHLTTTIFTKNPSANVEYQLKISKQGTLVLVDGFVTALSNVSSSTVICTFTDPLTSIYQPFTTSEPVGAPINFKGYSAVGQLWSFGSQDESTATVYLDVSVDGDILIPDGLLGGVTIRFQLTYNTNP